MGSLGVDVLGDTVQPGVLDCAVSTVDCVDASSQPSSASPTWTRGARGGLTVEEAGVDEDAAYDEEHESACAAERLSEARPAVWPASTAAAAARGSAGATERQLRRTLPRKAARELSEGRSASRHLC